VNAIASEVLLSNKTKKFAVRRQRRHIINGARHGERETERDDEPLCLSSDRSRVNESGINDPSGMKGVFTPVACNAQLRETENLRARGSRLTNRLSNIREIPFP
jgi:hypothetical protein